MIHLESITLREIRLPLREPFQISSGVTTERRILLVEIKNRDGQIGWGEAVGGKLPNYSPETIDTCWLAIAQWIAPKVLGEQFESPEQVYPHLVQDIRGHFMAKAAVEMACWELTARMRNISLSKLLGGTRSEIATGISLGIQESPQALVERAAAELAKGYRKIKIKIKPGKDVEFVRAVREAWAGGAADGRC